MFDHSLRSARALCRWTACSLVAPLSLAACAMPVDGGSGDEDPLVAQASELGTAPGTLDPSFGAFCLDTRARFTVASGVHAQLLPDGKILAAASVLAPDTGARELGMVRLLPSGAVDTSFGNGGYVRTGYGDDTVNASVEGLALAPDGKIVLAGSRNFVVVSPTGARSQPTVFIAARYLANGALDPSFGTGGKVETAVLGKADRAAAVLVQPDGKVLVAGSARENRPGYDAATLAALVRWNANGTLDTGFGDGGRVVATGPAIEALGLEANGSILAASPGLQRFSASGAPIAAAFNGTLASITAADFTSFALQADGKRVVGGSVRSLTNKHARIPTVGRVTVAGVSEFVTPGFNYGSPITGTTANLQALLVEPSGRIIAAGAAPLPGDERGFGLAAINASGTIDATFGGPQGLSTRITTSAMATALVQQPDNEIVALGACDQGIGLARYFGP